MSRFYLRLAAKEAAWLSRNHGTITIDLLEATLGEVLLVARAPMQCRANADATHPFERRHGAPQIVGLASREWLRLICLFEDLRVLGYEGNRYVCDTRNRWVKKRERTQNKTLAS